MNKIYKLVWSKVRNCYVAVSEIAKNRTKAPKSGTVNRVVAAGVLACVMSCGAVMPVFAVNTDNSTYGNTETDTATGNNNVAVVSYIADVPTLPAPPSPDGGTTTATSANAVSGVNNTFIGSVGYDYNYTVTGPLAAVRGTSNIGIGNTSGRYATMITDTNFKGGGNSEQTSIEKNIYLGNVTADGSAYTSAIYGIGKTENNIILGNVYSAANSYVSLTNTQNYDSTIKGNILIGNNDGTYSNGSAIKSKNNATIYDNIAIGNTSGAALLEGQSGDYLFRDNVVLGMAKGENGSVISQKNDNVAQNMALMNMVGNRVGISDSSNAVALGSNSATYSTGTDYPAMVEGEAAIGIGKDFHVKGDDAIVMGTESTALSDGSVSIGKRATVEGTNSIALGNESIVLEDEENVVSFGHGNSSTVKNTIEQGDITYNNELSRRLIHVAAGVNDTDAVNVSQLNEAIANLSGSGGVSYIGINSASGGANEDGSGAVGTDSIAVGKNAIVNPDASNSIVIGKGAGAEFIEHADTEFAYGKSGFDVGSDIIAIGTDARSVSSRNIAIGKSAGATLGKTVGGDRFNYVTTIYDTMPTQYIDSIAVGTNAMSNGNHGIAIGTGAFAVSGAYTDEGEEDEVNWGAIAIGKGAFANNQSTSIGRNSYASGAKNVALGDTAYSAGSTSTTAVGNVAVGSGSVTGRSEDGVVSFGAKAGDVVRSEITGDTYTVPESKAFTRRLINVSEGLDETDAVNLGQLYAVVEDAVSDISTGTTYTAGNKVYIENGEIGVILDGEVSPRDGGLVTGGQVYDAISGMANADASNVAANTGDWGAAIGTGAVEDGNTELVTGDTVYQALQNIDIPDNSTKYLGVNSNDNGDNNYNGGGATGTDAIALGLSAEASGTGSVAIGKESVAEETNSVSFGNSTLKRRLMNVADGTEDSDASTVAQTGKSLEVSESRLRLKNALGDELASVALSDLDTHVVTNNYITVNNEGEGTVSLTVNNLDISNDKQVVNVGTGTVTGEKSTAVGTGSTITGENSIAVGTGHQVAGNNSGAFGDPNIVNGDNSYVVGNNSQTAEGTSDVFVLGNNVNVTGTNTVVLGTGSDGSQDNVISVGSSTDKRRIVNVANGSTATDVATVGQTVELVAGNGMTIEEDGVNDIGQKKYKLSASGGGSENQNAVLYDAEDKGKVTLGGQVGTTLGNVKAGLISKTSKEAINGGQLWSVKQDIEGFAADIERNTNSIQTLNGSVSNALASVAAANTLVNTVNDLKADASLNNLSAAGKQVISNAAIDAVQQYMAQQNTSNNVNTGLFVNHNANISDLINDLSDDGNSVPKTRMLATSLRTLSVPNTFSADAVPDTNTDTNLDVSMDANMGAVYLGSPVLGDTANPSNDLESKADISYVDEGLATKADKDNVYSKSETDNMLSTKADISYVDEGLAEKADLTYVNDKLGIKADISYVDQGLSEKANVSDVYNKSEMDDKLFVKADKEYVDDSLSFKADKADLEGKADVDASNIDVLAWSEKLGVGEVEEGNSGLVNGGTVYNALREMRQNDMVTADDSAIHIGKSEKYDGIHAVDISDSVGNGRVLEGVITDPNSPTSAANVGYVNAIGESIVNGVNHGLERVNERVDKVGAGAAALASLATPAFDADEKFAFSAAVGNYKSETAAAVGMFYRPQDNVTMNLRGTVGNGENMVGGGVTVALQRGNTPAVSKAQLVRTVNAQAQKIGQQDAKIAEQDNRIANQNAEIAELKEQMAEVMKELAIAKSDARKN